MDNSESRTEINETGGVGRKKPIILVSAIIAAVALIVAAVTVTILLLNGGGEPPYNGDMTEVGEYYAPAGTECELKLGEDRSLTLVFSGETLVGTYTRDGSLLTLALSTEESAAATYADGVITLVYRGASLRLIKKIDFTVSFETGGGTKIESVTVMNGMTVKKPADPEKDGYIFVGWYKDGDFNEPFGFSADPITSDITVYARWTEMLGEREYTVTLELGYSGDAIAPITTVGGKIFDVPAPKREGFEFLGWWISTEGDSERPSYMLTEEVVIKSDLTAFAIWREEGSTRLAPPSLRLDGKSISWSSVSGARSYDVTLTDASGIAVFSRTVSGVSVAVDFSAYAAGVYTVLVKANANTGDSDSSTAYYTYTNKGLDKVDGLFVSDGNTLVYSGVENAEKYLVTVVCGNKAHRHTDLDNESSKTFSFANCPMTEDGIKFTVTAVAEGYLSSISDELVYKRELAPVGGFTWDEESCTVGFLPVENAEYYTVTVNCESNSHTHGNITDPTVDLKECHSAGGELTVSVRPVAEGYISPEATEFKLKKSAIGTPGGIKISGSVISWNKVAEADGYELSVNGNIYATGECAFDLSDAVGSQSGTAVEIKLRAIGGTASAWSNAVRCRVGALGTVGYSNGTLFWEHAIGAELYEISVNGSDTVEVRGECSARVTLDRAGENIIKLRFGKGDSRSEWLTLTVTAYAVSFDTLGGSSVATQYLAAGDTLSLPTAERLGYRFVSWYNVPEGPLVNGREITEAFKVKESVTLYAYYTPEKYEIIYNFGVGGTGSSSGTAVEYGKDYILEVPTATDPTVSFGGWFEAPYGKGVQYTDGSGVSLSPWNNIGGAEAYAFWIDETLVFTEVKVNGKDAYSVSAGPRISLVTDVTVPAYRNGLPVLMIDGGAFVGSHSLKVINIPASVEVVSTLDPFADCSSLVEINLYPVDGIAAPRYLSEDGILFENKTDGKALVRMPSGRVGDCVIPDGTIEIAEGAFIDSALRSVVIPKDVKKIANDAFANAKSLSLVTFAVSVSGSDTELTIGKRAFANCTALTSLTLPARLSDIELSKINISESGKFTEGFDYAFAGCTNLVDIGVADGSLSYRVIDGMIYSADGTQLLFCPVARGGSTVIPTGTQSVGAGAFVGCKNITEVYIPNTVTYVGEHAFRALGLSKVTFGGKGFGSVTVGDNAFASCEKLSEVVIETASQLAVIGERAFLGCTSLVGFTITPSVVSVRDNAFEGCTSLSSVTFDGGKRALEFGKNVFYNCTSLTTVEIPHNVSKIPGIFAGCTSLTEVKVDKDHPHFVSLDGVVFSKDMTEIVYYPEGRGGDYVIPDGVTTVAAGVFSGNKSLTSLVIPNTVSYIGEEAFKATDIRSITFSGDNHADSLVIERSAFEKARFDGYDLVLPSHTKEIGERAFSGVYYQKIILNDGLETLGDYAFYHPSNNNGATLVIPASVVSIGEYCFSGESIESSYVTAHCFFNVEFTAAGSRLAEIGDFAFYRNARLISLTLPDSVRTIGNYAFYECRSLSSVKLSASLETIGAYAFAASAYTYMVPIGTLTIPATVSSVGARAFENCQLLTTVTFEGTAASPDLALGTAYRRKYESDGVEMFAIERGHVFASCKRLTSVSLSANVTMLGDYCFAESGDSGFAVSIPTDSRLATVGAYCFYKARLESFTVPASVRNLEPTEEYGLRYDRLGIGDYAFATSVGALTEITFLKGGESYPLTIGYGAFENQSRLERIELPTRLSSYVSASGDVIPPLANGALVFYGASSLSEITVEHGAPYRVEGGVLYSADMRELVFCPVSHSAAILIPASVERIGSYAFTACSEITSVEFLGKSALVYIGDYAFFGCSSLKSIALPGGVATLGVGAFNYATALESITLSKSLKTVDISVFDGCTSLKSVIAEQGSAYLSSEDGVLYNANKTAVILYPMGRTDSEYTVKSGVLSVGKHAFAGNTHITKVVFPEGLKEINDSAFAGCTSLAAVLIPASVEIIGDSAFLGTASLGSLVFGAGGESKLVIGSSAFLSSGITRTELPARLAFIGEDAFRASALSVLTFEKSEDHQLTEIGAGAFAESQLISVEFPSGITTVGSSAFYGTDKLEAVIFGDGLEKLGDEAFKASTVTIVRLPRSLASLGASAFYNCSYLVEITFANGSQLTAIPEGAFYGCTSLVSFGVPSLVRELGGGKNKGAFENCSALSEFGFDGGDSCISIGAYAFSGCVSLAELEIPMSVGSLGAYAFKDCVSLTAVTVHHATVSLGEGLFSGCTSLAEVELDTGTDLLPAKMFENCESLTSVFIPATVTEIGDRCFFGTSIEQFDIAKDNKSFVSVSGILYNSSKTAIVCFPPKLNVTTLVIPKEVVEVRSNNFQYCSSIKEVIFEEGGTAPLTIGSYAFDGCYQLRRLVLPERLVSIGSYAFRECYALTSVTIPKNVTSIGNYAFSGCAKLYEVYNESAIEDIAKKGSLNYINNNYYSNARINVYTPTEGASVLFREGDFLFTTVNGVKRLIGYEGNDSEIILPSGSYDVADYMFCNDTSVKRVVIPSTANVSGSFVFDGCDSLEVILVSGGDIPDSWESGWNNGKLAFGGYSGEEIIYSFVTGVAPEIAPVTSKDVIELPTLTLDGYVFMGWYTSADTSGAPLTGSYYSAASTTLYAGLLTEEEYIELYLRGQSMEYAYAIESGVTYTVDIRSKGAQNYFSVTVEAGDVWNISTPTGMGYHKIWVYDESGKNIFTYYSTTASTLNDINYDYLFGKGGTYYIGVGYRDSSRKSGSFEVTFTKTDS